MAAIEPVFVGLMAVWGIIALAGFYVGYTRIAGKQKLILVSFQLHPDAVATEFRLLLGGMCLQFAAYLLSAIGIQQGLPRLVLLGRVIAAVFAAIILYVLFRWWNRARERGVIR